MSIMQEPHTKIQVRAALDSLTSQFSLFNQVYVSTICMKYRPNP